MEGPCRQISSLIFGSFHLGKENHWHHEAFCETCTCFKADVWTGAVVQFVRNIGRSAICWCAYVYEW